MEAEGIHVERMGFSMADPAPGMVGLPRELLARHSGPTCLGPGAASGGKRTAPLIIRQNSFLVA